MSQKSKKVLVLAFDQPRTSRIGTPMDPAVAELLLLRLAAEPISQKVIRMLPPDSEILAASHFSPTPPRYVPEQLERAEIVPGLKILRPAPDAASNIPQLHGLPRFREVYGDGQLQASL